MGKSYLQRVIFFLTTILMIILISNVDLLAQSDQKSKIKEISLRSSSRSRSRSVRSALDQKSNQKDQTLDQKDQRSSRSIDIAIVGGVILTMNDQKEVIQDGYLAIKGERIVDIGSRVELSKKYLPKKKILAKGRAIIPGLINTHTHVPMVLFRGIADDLVLQEWLEKYIFPAEAKNVSRDFCYWGTMAGCLEMIKSGITTYVDMYYFEDAIAEATSKAGMRGVLGETLIDFPVADNKTPQETLVYTQKFVERWRNSPLIIPAIAPHAPYTVKPDHLIAVKEFAEKQNVPIVIHLSETQAEVDDIEKRYGARPIMHLEKLGLLSNRLIAAHVVWANAEEIELLKKRGVGVAHSPQSNMKLACGVAPVPEMLKAGVAVGLGTDGAASNNDLNLFEEIDTAAKLHKLNSKNPTVISAKEALEMATIGGAKAIHLEKEIGSLEVGKRADLILVNLEKTHHQPLYNLYSSLAYTTKGSDVETTIINGKIVMQNGKVLTLNEAEINQKIKKYREQILESLK
ncbi:MAG: amidohydrolase [Acidobacteria bacterium]|nr:amidohydrolase [Acidobacteriota bacterium]